MELSAVEQSGVEWRRVPPKLKAGQWVKVRAKVGYEKLAMYRGVGPVLTAENIEPAEPIEEMVYFN